MLLQCTQHSNCLTSATWAEQFTNWILRAAGRAAITKMWRLDCHQFIIFVELLTSCWCHPNAELGISSSHVCSPLYPLPSSLKSNHEATTYLSLRLQVNFLDVLKEGLWSVFGHESGLKTDAEDWKVFNLLVSQIKFRSTSSLSPTTNANTFHRCILSFLAAVAWNIVFQLDFRLDSAIGNLFLHFVAKSISHNWIVAG